jgi:hypothetical protein
LKINHLATLLPTHTKFSKSPKPHQGPITNNQIITKV